MQWLAQNWFWVLIFVLFIGLHLFGHGSHGGRGGGCGGHGGQKRPDEKDRDTATKSSTGHQH